MSDLAKEITALLAGATPGPWETIPVPSDDDVQHAIMHKGSWIAGVGLNGQGESYPDAALIAAAPSLLKRAVEEIGALERFKLFDGDGRVLSQGAVNRLICDRESRSTLIDRLKADLKTAEDEVKRLTKELETYQGLIDEPMKVTRLLFENGEWDIRGHNPIIALMAQAFLETFERSGAVNYLEQEVEAPLMTVSCNAESEVERWVPLVITIQRKDRKTPHQFRKEAEASLKTATEALEFYALNESWVGDFVDPFKATVEIDGGKRAREDLAALKGRE